MKKNILVGIVVGLLLIGISFSFLSNSKNVEYGENYYNKVNFDFVIPKPWFSQIAELKSLQFVEEISPYYLSDNTLSANGNRGDVFLYLIEEKSTTDITPFSKKLITDGKTLSKKGIVVDESVKSALNLSVGDSVSVNFGVTSIELKIDGFVQSNLFAPKMSAIAYFSDEIKSTMEKNVNHLSYAAAFVKVKDVVSAEHYFNEDYRAMGKVGERSWYKDDSAYEYAKESISNIKIGREVTNVAQLKANSKSNTDTAQKFNVMNLLKISFVVFAIEIVVWVIMIFASAKQYRSRIKNGTRNATIINEFRIGEIISLLIFVLSFVLFKNIANNVQIGVLFTFALIGAIISIILTSKIINRK